MVKLGLRIGWMAACVALVGCDGGDEGDRDSGPDDLVDSGMPQDAGGGGTDAGPPVDAGPRDAGGGGGSCGPTGGACDIGDPSSCGAGMACVLRLESEGGPVNTFCVQAGTGMGTAACDPATDGQCAEGFDCFPGTTTCSQYCCGNTDCEAGQICQPIGGANGAGVCRGTDSCTVLPQGGCDGGEACYVFDAETGSVTCEVPGTAMEAEECDSLSGCVAGFACILTGPPDDGRPAFCRGYCDTTAEPACAEGYVCAPFAPPIGVCIQACDPEAAESTCPTGRTCIQQYDASGAEVPNQGTCSVSGT